METKINFKGLNLTVMGEIQRSIVNSDHFVPGTVEVDSVLWNGIDIHDLLLQLGVMNDVINEILINQ